MKSLTKIISFILVLAAVLGILHLAISGLFGVDPGFLRHSGPGHVTFYILFVLNVILFQKFVNRRSFYSLGFKRYTGWQKTVFKGWFVGVLSFIGYTLVMDSAGIIDIQLKYGVGRILLAIVIALTGFGIAITEEILFRGFFLQTMLRDLPRWVAVLLTGIIFVFFHKLGAMQDFWTLPYDAMLAGGIFCLHMWLTVAYLKTGSLYLPTGIHSGLVCAKVFFRALKLTEVDIQNSYIFGLNGDARRGFLTWGLFLCGILILPLLIGKREKEAKA
jgi:membrane protease YdiL (CAAX protease family)